MHLLICGDRNWTNKKSIKSLINAMIEKHGKDNLVIIEGCCSGADQMAGAVSKELGIALLEFPAEWSLYGRSAGPIRNKRMLVEGKPDLVVAFHNNIQASRGTRNMLSQAEKAGIPYLIIAAQQGD